MEYQTLTDDHRRLALFNRLSELEQQHLTNSILLTEAELIGAESQVKEFKAVVENLEFRIDAYRKMLTDDESTE